jgi:hypothetical protein
MTLTNHLLTGAVVGKYLPWPIAVPLAFASHFVLDSLPHFGFKSQAGYQRHKKFWIAVVTADLLTSLLMSLWLLRAGHLSWWLVGFVAFMPDLVWVPWLVRVIIRGDTAEVGPRKEHWFIRFHAKIQRYERPWGICVELVYFALVVAVLR